MSRGASSVVLVSVVAVLCAIGVVAAIGRGVDVATALRVKGQGTGITPYQQWTLDQLATLYAEADPTRYRESLVETPLFNAPYVAHPIPTLLHVVPGALLLALAPLQFSSRIRSRHIRLHRWSGRVLLMAALTTGSSALFFGLLMPYAGRTEAAAATLFGGLFLFAGARAFAAIRGGDVIRHREWMIRMFALALAVSTVRLVYPSLVAMSSASLRELFGLSLWIGWPVTLAAAELWIRYTRSDRGTKVPRYRPTIST